MRRHVLLCSLALMAFQSGLAVAADLSPCETPSPDTHVPATYGQAPNRLRFWVTMHDYMTDSTSVVGLASHGDVREVILVTARKNVDPTDADSRYDTLMRLFPTAPSPATTLHVSRISQGLYQWLYSEWDRSVRQARPEPDLTMDGARYEFHSDSGGCAYTHSPSPPSRAFFLMVLAGDLSELAMKQISSVSRPDESPVIEDLSSLEPPGHAYFLQNIRGFQRDSDLTVLVRIRKWSAASNPWQRVLNEENFHLLIVDADVVESFHGKAPKRITFKAILPLGEVPPSEGEYIISLKGNAQEGYEPSDDSMFWTRATPGLLRTLRGAH